MPVPKPSERSVAWHCLTFSCSCICAIWNSVCWQNYNPRHTIKGRNVEIKCPGVTYPSLPGQYLSIQFDKKVSGKWNVMHLRFQVAYSVALQVFVASNNWCQLSEQRFRSPYAPNFSPTPCFCAQHGSFNFHFFANCLKVNCTCMPAETRCNCKHSEGRSECFVSQVHVEIMPFCDLGKCSVLLPVTCHLQH